MAGQGDRACVHCRSVRLVPRHNGWHCENCGKISSPEDLLRQLPRAQALREIVQCREV